LVFELEKKGKLFFVKEHIAGLTGLFQSASGPLLRSQLRERGSCRVKSSLSHSRVGSLDASGLRIGIVVARFNELVTKLLLEGALDAFSRHGGAESEVSFRFGRIREVDQHFSRGY
jgi:hypothetical protein